MPGHICIICTERKTGCKEPGMICAGCYLDITRCGAEKSRINWKRYEAGELDALISEARNLESDTIRNQGNNEAKMNMEIASLRNYLNLRDEYIKSTDNGWKNFEKFLEDKARKLAENSKKPTCAPGKISPQWTACGELAAESKVANGSEQITCPDCIKALNEGQEGTAVPKSSPAASKDEQPGKDMGGKMERK